MRKSAVMGIIFLLFSQICVASLSCEIEIAEEEYKRGETVKGILNIENLNYTGFETNVLLVYSIEDKTITEKMSTIPLGKERTKILELDLPQDISSGEHFFVVTITHLEETFRVQDSFFVKSESSFPLWVLVLILLLSIISFLVYRCKIHTR